MRDAAQERVVTATELKMSASQSQIFTYLLEERSHHSSHLISSHLFSSELNHSDRASQRS